MLRLDHVSTFYGNIQALKQVSIDVAEGEIVTLIGANGAGKTTTLKTISGLIRSSEGRIYFQGKDITAAPPHEIVKMGISHVPEGRHVFPRLTLRENLEMGAFFRKDRNAVTTDLDEVMETFSQLKGREKQLAGTLSGGEQQMLAIGRALMSRPKLLLLDEPSMGLAPLIVREIFRIIEEINSQGTTILLVEQNAQIALQTAARGYVMETGQIVMYDNAPALLHNDQVRRAYLSE